MFSFFDHPAFAAVWIAGVALHAVGCNSSKSPVHDVQMARGALNIVLETWKAGGRAEDLHARNPKIMAGDWQWSQGQRLIGYEIDEAASLAGECMRVAATLTVQTSPGAKPKTINVVYAIVLGPEITIIREFE